MSLSITGPGSSIKSINLLLDKMDEQAVEFFKKNEIFPKVLTDIVVEYLKSHNSISQTEIMSYGRRLTSSSSPFYMFNAYMKEYQVISSYETARSELIKALSEAEIIRKSDLDCFDISTMPVRLPAATHQSLKKDWEMSNKIQKFDMALRKRISQISHFVKEDVIFFEVGLLDIQNKIEEHNQDGTILTTYINPAWTEIIRKRLLKGSIPL